MTTYTFLNINIKKCLPKEDIFKRPMATLRIYGAEKLGVDHRSA